MFLYVKGFKEKYEGVDKYKEQHRLYTYNS